MKKIILFSFIMGFAYNLSAQQCDSTLPVMESFDSDVINVCWDIQDADGDNNNWMWWEYSAYYGGHKVIASYSYYTSTGALTPDNWIMSHAIDLTSFNTSDDIELSWKARAELNYLAHEYYTVYAATGNQVNNFEASPIQRGEYMDEIGGAGVFVTRTLDVSDLAGSMIYIAFRHHNSTDQSDINIDDVSISTSLLGVDDLKIDNFKHYYNTNTDELTLKSNISFDNILVYNILGQEILDNKLSRSEETINLSHLNDGIYIAKIQADNASKIIKFLKQ